MQSNVRRNPGGYRHRHQVSKHVTEHQDLLPVIQPGELVRDLTNLCGEAAGVGDLDRHERLGSGETRLRSDSDSWPAAAPGDHLPSKSDGRHHQRQDGDAQGQDDWTCPGEFACRQADRKARHQLRAWCGASSVRHRCRVTLPVTAPG